jgi:glutathione peroxidase
MYQKYKDSGLQILGFPCGQFMGQELSTDKEIRNFIDKKFNVDFPMFSKIEVNGNNTHPIFKYLKYNSGQMNQAKGLKNIPWNFAKFLVNSQGEVIKFYEPGIKPVEMMKDIQPLLRI